MLVFTVEELENLGIPYNKASQFVFRGKRFIKSLSFSQKARQAAIDLYRNYIDSGTPCLMVESPEYITICRQR